MDPSIWSHCKSVSFRGLGMGTRRTGRVGGCVRVLIHGDGS